MTLTVLLPTLNEAQNISLLLPRVKKVAEELVPHVELLIVDAGSTDGTPDEARHHGARVLAQQGRGFGAALREGFAAARGQYILTMDCDGSHSPETLPKLWEMRHGQVLVIASRYVKGGSAEMPFSRRALSRCLNWATRHLLGLPVMDSSSGLRLYEAAALRALSLKSPDFSVQQEVLLALLASGGRVAEVPFHYAPRLEGRSKARVFPLALSYMSLLGKGLCLRRPWDKGILKS